MNMDGSNDEGIWYQRENLKQKLKETVSSLPTTRVVIAFSKTHLQVTKLPGCR